MTKIGSPGLSAAEDGPSAVRCTTASKATPPAVTACSRSDGPIATLSIEAQERHERREKVYRDD